MLSHDQLERERYEARMKFLQDQKSWEKTAELLVNNARKEGRIEGQVEGRVEGEAVGRLKGIAIGQIQLNQRLLRQTPMPTEELSGLALEELQQRAQQLEEELQRHLSGLTGKQASP